jgi:hypothetical protein
MNCLIVTLYDRTCLDDVLVALTAHDVRQAFVLDGRAVAPVLMEDVPLFIGFRVDLDEPRGAVKLVLALIESVELARHIVAELQGTGTDLTDPDVAKVVLLPAEEIR